jgi:hypothetical protein
MEEVKEKPIVEEAKMPKFMNYKASVLEEFGIQLKDLFGMEGITINLRWIQIARLVNHEAKAKVLTMDNTAVEFFEMFNNFLV